MAQRWKKSGTTVAVWLVLVSVVVATSEETRLFVVA